MSGHAGAQRRSRRAATGVAVAAVVVALLAGLVLGLSGGDPSRTGSTRLLSAWCAHRPDDLQRRLVAALGGTSFRAPPGRGHRVLLDVAVEPLVRVAPSTLGVPRRLGFAVWRTEGYLLVDTYARGGAITGMYAWPLRASRLGELRCPLVRSRARGRRTRVPDLLDASLPAAEAALATAHLTSALLLDSPSSVAYLARDLVVGQLPRPGSIVHAGEVVTVVYLSPRLPSDELGVAVGTRGAHAGVADVARRITPRRPPTSRGARPHGEARARRTRRASAPR